MALSANVGRFKKHSARFACLDVGCKPLRTSQMAVWAQANSPTKNEKTGKFERRCVAVLPEGVRQSSKPVFIFPLFCRGFVLGKCTPKWPGPSTLRDLRVRECSFLSFLDDFDSSSPRRESRRLKSRRGKVFSLPSLPGSV